MARVGWAATLAIALLVGAASAGAARLADDRTPTALEAPAAARAAPATSTGFTDERSVDVTFTRVQPQPVQVARAGLVTRTACVPGGTLTSGRPALWVDERVVIGLHLQVPLYRTLTRGVTGKDVESLQNELNRLGNRIPVTARYDAATAAAVIALERAAGVTSPDGTAAPAQFAWLPSPVVAIAACELAIGQRAGEAATFATSPSSLAAVRLAPLPSTALPGERTVRLFGASAPLPSTGEITDPTFLAALGTNVDYLASEAAKDADRPKATAALSTALTVYKVPPGAVFAVNGTHGCVRSGGVSVPVTIVGSGLGAALVTAATALTEVAIGPGITSTDCPAP